MVLAEAVQMMVPSPWRPVWEEMRGMTFTTVVARLHGHPEADARPDSQLGRSQLPRSQVSVLVSEEEIRAAIERAITFERGIASRAAEKISRYEQIVRHETLREEPTSDSDAALDEDLTA